MRKPVKYLSVSIGAAALVAAAALLVIFSKAEPGADDILALYRDDARYSGLTIDYPLDETLFPCRTKPPGLRIKNNGRA